MKTVLVDTSALLPFLDQDDTEHLAIVETVKHLVGDDTALITTSYVLVETSALVRSRLGLLAFKALGAAVDRAMEVVWVDEDLHRRAWAKAIHESKQGASLVDWVSFLAMKDLGIDHALTLDRHFRRQGFRTLP